MPITRLMWRGPMPAPVHAPPATGFDDVTKGYVPWSRSRNVAWAPSSSTCCPRRARRGRGATVSAMYGASPRRDLARGSGRRSRRRRAAAGCRPWPGFAFFSFSTASSFSRKISRVEQVLHAQADALGLVGVGRPDAALGGAELVLATSRSVDRVELLVVRQDQVGVAATPSGGDSRCPRPRAGRSRRAAPPGRRRRRCRSPA